MPRPPRKHKKVERDGYELTFYPGFLSQCTVEATDGTEVVLYKQKKFHDIRGKDDEPLKKSRISLGGGKYKRDFSLTIDDPHHQIAQIVVRLHPEGHQPGEALAATTEPVETVTLDNWPVLCPPYCE